MISREGFNRLLDAFADAIMTVAIRSAKNSPAPDQHQALDEAVRARQALERAVFP